MSLTPMFHIRVLSLIIQLVKGTTSLSMNHLLLEAPGKSAICF